MDSLTFAKFYATQHHVVKNGQLYGVVPYTHHLADVEQQLRVWGEKRDDLLVAAWLHDIVEDTDVKLRDIEENFGEGVALLVGAVTSEEGPDRRVRNALTYPKIRAAGEDAVFLKLADRMCNLTQSFRTGGTMAKKYAKEHAQFRTALYDPSHVLGNIWRQVDDLADQLLNGEL